MQNSWVMRGSRWCNGWTVFRAEAERGAGCGMGRPQSLLQATGVGRRGWTFAIQQQTGVEGRRRRAGVGSGDKVSEFDISTIQKQR